MTLAATNKQPEQQVGRYAIFDQIAAGGMARVHLARLTGQEGFSRVVAVKRMHPHLLEDEEFRRMFLAEARLAARIQHPNVVPILDVLAVDDELLIVMEYVHGTPLHVLVRASSASLEARITEPIACAIVTAVLYGLHAAHEAHDTSGALLGIVHRDVSPHNVIVGVDGVARLLDFGVAKAAHAQQHTTSGVIKGKLSYMAPEVIIGKPATRQADIFSAAAVFWELLAGRKLFTGATTQERILNVLEGNYPTPRSLAPTLSPEVEEVVMRGLAISTDDRYATARDMAIALESVAEIAPLRLVGEWAERLGKDELAQRAEVIQQIETSSVIAISHSILPPSIAAEQTSEASEVRRVTRWSPWFLAPLGAVILAGLVLAVWSLGRGRNSAATTSSNVSAASPASSPAESTARPSQLPKPRATTSTAGAPSASAAAAPSAAASAVAAPSATAPSTKPTSVAKPRVRPLPRRAVRNQPRSREYLPDDL